MLVIIATDCPEDPISGIDFRLWHLCAGNAIVLCSKRKVNAENREPLTSPLEWKDVVVLDVPYSPKANMEAWTQAVASAVARLNISSANPVLFGLGLECGRVACALQGRRTIVDLKADSHGYYAYTQFQAISILNPLRKLRYLGRSIRVTRWERKIAQESGAVLVAGLPDADYLNRGITKKIVAIGNGTTMLQDAPAYHHRLTGQVVGFHGAMTWGPNIVAAKALSTRIAPRIRRAVPSAQFKIAGGPYRDDVAGWARAENVELCGYVPSLRDWLSECDVYAMPMQDGGGVKNKLIETMAAGMPIVTTSRGAQGLPSDARESVRIVDSHRQFASAVCDLLNDADARIQMGRAARNAAERHFSWPAYSGQFEELVQRVREENELRVEKTCTE